MAMLPSIMPKKESKERICTVEALRKASKYRNAIRSGSMGQKWKESDRKEEISDWQSS
jgi:hypothetical protein